MAKWIAPALTGLLVTAGFGVSLFFEGAQSDAYAPALVLLVAGLLLACLPAVWNGCALPRTAPAWLLFLLWLYVTISLAWTTTPFPSLVTYLVFCCLPLTFFALLLPPQKARFIQAASWGLQIALTVLGAWAVMQVTIFHDRYPGRAGYPLLDANNLAALMNLALLPNLARALTLKRGWKRLAAIAATLILFAGLTATESRGGLLCFLAMAIPLLVLLRRALFPSKLAVLAIAIAVLFTAMSWHGESGGLAGRLTGLAHISQDDDAMNRPVLWDATLRMIAEHPLTGTGLGSFYLTYPSHRPIADKWSAGQWAHNDPLQFAAEMGLAAPLLLYAFLGSLLWRSRSALKSNALDTEARAAIAGPLAGFFAMILHSHIEFQLYLMPILIVSGVWLADWYERTARLSPSVQNWAALAPEGWQRPAGALTLAVLGALILIPAIQCGMATHELNRAIAVMRKGQPKTFDHILDRADAWGPRSFIDAKMQRSTLYIDLLKTPKGLFDAGDQQSMVLYVQTTLDMAEKLVPLWSDVNDKRALLYLNMRERLTPGWEDMAEMQLRTALAKNPLDLNARSQLIQLRMKQEDVENAYDLVGEGLERPHPIGDQKNMLALQAQLAHLVAMKQNYKERPQ